MPVNQVQLTSWANSLGEKKEELMREEEGSFFGAGAALAFGGEFPSWQMTSPPFSLFLFLFFLTLLSSTLHSDNQYGRRGY